MKIATTDALYTRRINSRRTRPEAICALGSAGFQSIDLCFLNRRHLPENWEEELSSALELGRKLGIDFPSCHLPYPFFGEEGTAERAEAFRMTKEAIDAAAFAGVRWAVVHPLTQFVESRGSKNELEQNHALLWPIIEYALQRGVGIAIENMRATMPGCSEGQRRFCSLPEELCALIDGFGSPKVCACWDFGHANITGIDQNEALLSIGTRLRIIHVHDNFKVEDNHQPPFCGTINWSDVVGTLKKIGFQGDFNYEVLPTRLPDNLDGVYFRFLVEMARGFLEQQL